MQCASPEMGAMLHFRWTTGPSMSTSPQVRPLTDHFNLQLMTSRRCMDNAQNWTATAFKLFLKSLCLPSKCAVQIHSGTSCVCLSPNSSKNQCICSLYLFPKFHLCQLDVLFFLPWLENDAILFLPLCGFLLKPMDAMKKEQTKYGKLAFLHTSSQTLVVLHYLSKYGDGKMF